MTLDKEKFLSNPKPTEEEIKKVQQAYMKEQHNFPTSKEDMERVMTDLRYIAIMDAYLIKQLIEMIDRGEPITDKIEVFWNIVLNIDL